jgi:hypothetical protein
MDKLTEERKTGTNTHSLVKVRTQQIGFTFEKKRWSTDKLVKMVGLCVNSIFR